MVQIAAAVLAAPAIASELENGADAVDRLVLRLLSADFVRGCVVVMGTRDRVQVRRAYGDRAVFPERERMTANTTFDLASLTKPVATASSILVLSERGRFELDALVSAWVPSFRSPEKAAITIRMLLTHTSGLPAANALSHYDHTTQSLLDNIGSLALRFPPGTGYTYSDVGYVVLGALIERLTGEGLSDFARAAVFEPLGMHMTGFRPKSNGHFAPTALEGGRMLRGIVHDPRARKMGGVAGHAGLFSTADDLARFARAVLGDGVIDGSRVLRADTVASMWKSEGHPMHPRTVAWDVVQVWDPNAGRLRKTFAHGGFTGTYVWLDPERGTFLVLLSSRLHPDGRGSVRRLRAALRSHAVGQRP